MAKKKEFDSIDFTTLVGARAALYLFKPETNCFQLGKITFEVIEDENDGYRSSMQEVRILDTNSPLKIFLSDVVIGCSTIPNEDIYILTDLDGHEWLRFGTNNTDDYYPSFHFNWNPKESKELLEIKKLINTKK